jgi:hypothetical protein
MSTSSFLLTSLLFRVACSDQIGADDCTLTRTCTTGAGTSGSSGTGAGGSGAGGSEAAGTSNAGGMGGSSGTAGGGGGAAGEGGSEACEGDVGDDAACWTSNTYGVFVSNEHGDDASGDGTKEAPYKSITKGLSSAAGKKVFVCLGPSGDYTDALSFDSAEGISIYGGFECESWEYSATRKAGIKPAKNIGLRINKSKNLTFENLRITAADATGSGYDASSYGAFVTDSQAITFRRVELTAGKGAKGADGAAGGRGMNGAEAGAPQNGQAGECLGDNTQDGVPGKWPAILCGSKGGNGGPGLLATDGASGTSGIPETNVTPPDFKNFGSGTGVVGVPGGLGGDGSPGNDGALGTAAPMLGTFNAMGYVGGNGKVGSNGFPGQGGGGGGASKGTASCRGASGGAGGMGGCGGSAGSGGLGGGASVGLMSWSSEVQLESSAISSGAGGDGGKGGAGGGGGTGAVGGIGGQPDAGNNVARGGAGGAGGNGGIGGSGSGGTGGASYGLVYRGTKPVFTEPDTKLTAGPGGAAGPGGQLDDEAPKAPDGAEGLSEAELEVVE